jgi:hypothetical protein
VPLTILRPTIGKVLLAISLAGIAWWALRNEWLPTIMLFQDPNCVYARLTLFGLLLQPFAHIVGYYLAVPGNPTRPLLTPLVVALDFMYFYVISSIIFYIVQNNIILFQEKLIQSRPKVLKAETLPTVKAVMKFCPNCQIYVEPELDRCPRCRGCL